LTVDKLTNLFAYINKQQQVVGPVQYFGILPLFSFTRHCVSNPRVVSFGQQGQIFFEKLLGQKCVKQVINKPDALPTISRLPDMACSGL
jgi:hypothetical protein